MTAKIKKSQIGDADFGKLVQAHIDDLSSWDLHMAEVRAQEGRPKEEQTHQPYPAPTAHPMVESAIRRDGVSDGRLAYVADFEVEDDTPTDAERLRASKDAMIHAVDELEALAISRVQLPPGKRRLHALKVADASKKDEGHRSGEDRHLLKEHDASQLRMAAIQQHAAELQSQIEDLDDFEAVNAWKPGAFPK